MSRFLGRNFRLVLVSAVITAAWSFGGVRSSVAQTAAEPNAEQVAAQARSALSAGRLNDAIEAYARAYQVGGDPNMLFDMAEVHRLAGHDTDALRTFQTYLRRDPNGAHRESAERQITELERKAREGGAAKPVVTSPVVTSPVVPPPVVPPPVVPAAPRVSPPVGAAPGAAAVVPPPPPPAQTASGAPVTSSTAPPPPSSWNGGAPAPQTGTTPPAVDLTASALPPQSSPNLPMPRWVPWTLGAATVAVGTVAIIAGLSASSRFDDLNSTCGRTAQGCATSDIDDVRSRARRANILWALTGAAAVATGVTVYVNANAAGAAGLWAF